MLDRDDGHVYGLDISSYMHKVASKRLRPFIRAKRATLLISDVEFMPFLESSFDVCFHINSFYFWADLDYALRQVYRVLKPGGRVACAFSPKLLRRFKELGYLAYARYDPLTYSMALEASGFSHLEWRQWRDRTPNDEPADSVPHYIPFDTITASKPYLKMLSDQ
ncbi:unnamed protein product [Protopolystoma xenopodis]|uniref:Methyltransferase type 11 domain-containing protein n=1 Tax=Protopolystoma xenopodis TaxID=117903 RepID=A0A3S5A3M1_9PLAT|nr:unnamed protein product [Protopolystoma xenopodis]